MAIGILILTFYYFILFPKVFSRYKIQVPFRVFLKLHNPFHLRQWERQQALARVVLNDPAVENVSSFIGIDGTNTTLNSGRMLITLKTIS